MSLLCGARDLIWTNWLEGIILILVPAARLTGGSCLESTPPGLITFGRKAPPDPEGPGAAAPATSSKPSDSSSMNSMDWLSSSLLKFDLS